MNKSMQTVNVLDQVQNWDLSICMVRLIIYQSELNEVCCYHFPLLLSNMYQYAFIDKELKDISVCDVMHGT